VVNDVDLMIAVRDILARLDDRSAKQVFAQKETLLLRPLRRLLGNPHALAGFIGRFAGDLWELDGESVKFAANPMRFLQELYHYLNIENAPNKPPSEIIWEKDEEIIEQAVFFYGGVSQATGVRDWNEMNALIGADSNADVAPGDPELWKRCQATHRGLQVGMELLLLIPAIGIRSRFSEIEVSESFEVLIPEVFSDAESGEALIRHLAPPPKASSDEIVAPMGGAFFARDAPHLPLLIAEGEHFDEGQPLFIIEVMKMFNKVLAPFSGTVVENLMKDKDGEIITKGQQIFRIEPDEKIVEESAEEIDARQREVTLELLARTGA
jgi:biotin carboxyl carrier protein